MRALVPAVALLVGLAPVPVVAPAAAAAAALDLLLLERIDQRGASGTRYTQGNSAFTARLDQGAITVFATPGANSVTATFVPPTDRQLSPGTYQVGPAATADLGSVRLDDPDGSCREPAGSFVVHEAVAADGVVQRFAASYSLFCGPGSGTDRARAGGEVRFRSDSDYRALSAPAGLRLPDTAVGRETSRDLQVDNSGTADVRLGTAALSGADAGRFRIAGDGCSGRVLAPGGSCTLTVAMSLDAAGEARALLRLPEDTPLGLRQVALVGRALPVPSAPGVAVFSGVDGVGVTAGRTGLRDTQGETVEYRFFRVRDGVMSLAAVLPPRPDGVAVFADTTVPAAGSATYRVTAVSAGGESPPSVDITGSAQAEPGPAPGPHRVLLLDAPSADTAPAVAIQVSDLEVLPATRPRRLTVRVGTTGTLTVDYPAAGLPPGQYRGDGSAGNSVSFDLQGVRAGACSGTAVLTVRESAFLADGRPRVLDLGWTLPCGSGTTLQAHGELRLDARRGYAAAATTPTRVDAGPVTAGQRSTAQPVVLRNTGTAEMTLGAPRLTGPAAADWQVLGSTCPAVLVPGGECTLDLAVTPSERGDRAALLVVPDGTALGQRQVLLTAEGRVVPSAVRFLEADLAVERAQVRWAQGDNGGAPVERYQVSRSIDGGPFQQVAELPVDVTRYDDPGVQAGRSYVYEVAAVSAVGRGAPSRTGSLGPAPSRELLASVSSDSGYSVLRVPLSGGARLTQEALGREQDTPAVSPDGRSVAYAVPTATGAFLAVSALDGSGSRQVTSGAEDAVPTWSRDGGTLVFVRHDGDVPVLHTVPAAGGTPVAVPGGRGYDRPSFLPDGRRVIATRDLERPALHVVALDGSARSALPGGDGGFDPAVSPDGRTVAFAHLDGAATATSIRALPLGGGEPTVLAAPGGLNTWPAWAPDGSEVYFERATLDADLEPGPADVFRVSRSGGAATNITRTPGVDETEPTVHDATSQPPVPTPPTSTPPAETDLLPQVQVSPGTVTPGVRATVLVQAAPGSVVELYAYSRPSTTYGVVRKAVIGEAGRVAFDVTPGTNTRLYASATRAGATTTSTSRVLNVQTALSLSVVRRGTRDYVFQGRLLPRRAGQQVTLYRRVDGRDVITASVRSDSSGTWRIPRRFTGTGTFDFLARTGRTLTNDAGSSRVVRSRIS